MSKKPHLHVSDLAGLNRLAVTATTGITDLAEALHRTISGSSRSEPDMHSRIADVVYDSVRGITRLVGNTTDTVLSRFPILQQESSPEREAVLAALNGVLGDHLAATNNPLAIPMRIRRAGLPLAIERDSLRTAIPAPRHKLLLFVHGLCMNDLQWTERSGDFEPSLARDLGYTVLHLHYNSGQHISTNGRALAILLETLLAQWPDPLTEFSILTHSLGGLLVRSAHHYATHSACAWPQHLQTLIFLGTPHDGAPLERIGNMIDIGLTLSPYSAPFSRLGKIRSAGITDLRHGNLLDEDWLDRDRFEHPSDLRHPVPLPPSVATYAIAANTGSADAPVGDGMVTIDSALGRHRNPSLTLSFPPSHQWIAHGMNHCDLLSAPAVHAKIKSWLTTRP